MSLAGKKYDFTGKVALVTGSSSGIGAAIAIQFAQNGARVTITGRDAKTLEEVAAKIQEVSGQPALQVLGDLLDATLAPKLVQQTVDKFGAIDFLVNNAGMGTPKEQFDAPDLMDQYDRVMGLNVRSVLQLTQLAVPYLEKTKGAIVNISSIAALHPWGLVYSTSKAALDMLTKTSASQLASKGIRVNSINPGPVYTAIGRSMDKPNFFQEQEEMMRKWTPLSRIAQPEEIANLASFLVSDLAANMTGSIVVSDGGVLIRSG